MVVFLALRPMGFGTLHGLLAQRLLKQGYQYRGLHKAFSGFCRRCYGLVSGFRVGLKSLFCLGLWESEFCGGLVYVLGRIAGSGGF